MSLASWKQEFYPIPADTFEGEDIVDAVDSVEHALTKWKGLRAEALRRHELYVNTLGAVTDKQNRSERLYIDSGSCSLCAAYMDKNDDDDQEEDYEECSGCPLYLVRSGVRCDQRMPNEAKSPYYRFDGSDSRNPEPMIEWLEKTLEFVKQGGAA